MPSQTSVLSLPMRCLWGRARLCGTCSRRSMVQCWVRQSIFRSALKTPHLKSKNEATQWRRLKRRSACPKRAARNRPRTTPTSNKTSKTWSRSSYRSVSTIAQACLPRAYASIRSQTRLHKMSFPLFLSSLKWVLMLNLPKKTTSTSRSIQIASTRPERCTQPQIKCYLRLQPGSRLAKSCLLVWRRKACNLTRICK